MTLITKNFDDFELNEGLKSTIDKLYKKAKKLFTPGPQFVKPTEDQFYDAKRWVDYNFGDGHSVWALAIDRIEKEANIVVGEDKADHSEQVKVPLKDLVIESVVNEARSRKVTKQMWKKMDADQRENALLSVVKDPDDIKDDWIEGDWNDLPSGFERDMEIWEGTQEQLEKKLNEANVTKKHIDKKIDEISNLSKELKANFAKYKSAKTEDEKKEFMTNAADLTKKKHAADAELEKLIQSFGKDMELDINFESNLLPKEVDLGQAVGEKEEVLIYEEVEDLFDALMNKLDEIGAKTTDPKWKKAIISIYNQIDKVNGNLSKYDQKLGSIPIKESLDEAEDYKYKKNVSKAFEKINDAMFEFRHAMGVKQLTNKDNNLKNKFESIHQAIFDLQREMKSDGLTESLDEAKDPVYKKGDKVLVRLTHKGGVGKYADSISTSKNTEEVRIKKRIKNKITGGYKYELSNWITVHPSEIVGLA